MSVTNPPELMHLSTTDLVMKLSMAKVIADDGTTPEYREAARLEAVRLASTIRDRQVELLQEPRLSPVDRTSATILRRNAERVLAKYGRPESASVEVAT